MQFIFLRARHFYFYFVAIESGKKHADKLANHARVHYYYCSNRRLSSGHNGCLLRAHTRVSIIVTVVVTA